MSDTDFETIEWSYDEETGLGRITLDRPEAMNAINIQMQHDLIDAFDAFQALDDEGDGIAVRAVIVDSAGEKAFCSGLDVGEMSDFSTYHEKKRVPDLFCEMCAAFEEYHAPVIAAVDGLCLGGGFEIVMSSDFRFAVEEATFGQPEVNFGVLPGGAAAQRLTTIVGAMRAKEITMTGERIGAVDAAEEGILTDVVADEDELEAEVDELASELASKPPLAVRSIKQASNITRNVGYDAGIEFASHAWPALAQSDDYAKAIDAFGTDEQPEFEGK
ncbi:enoyl-CoA hydratase/isomerase family protein [Halobellus sp. Atlit-38R]|uniref:enoyl-CoA hydratase/isomerase family protein n=1 Tax=Halobellus sp. Atlit-38R TaxID=2282131 RepID=UPI000EF234EB|nr:enoyl-CoA hydratase/isomerase family protein [Halobellus sp. Atlit-38R]RLM88523.1 enoyl-CoA hydratase/isomerase family protein [Halobellus sp. Atlit-38R]